MTKSEGPKILLVDIETAPIIAAVWKLWDENVGLNQIQEDWHLLSCAAKWLDDPPSKVMYKDQSKTKNIEDDSKILNWIWGLLDEADIIITQNGKAFDQKKLNARFVLKGMQPPSSFKHIDTKILAKKYFGFTSNRLEYLSDKLCKKYKKLPHKKFAGFELWKECLAGNKAAWKEMEKYNKHDVLALEELYHVLKKWDSQVNFSLYYSSEEHVCSCGSTDFKKYGWYYTATGKYQRYKCTECGSETRDRNNQFSKEKRKSLRVGTTR